ncbi:MAG: metallophosphoesterase [Phycisphaerales bacterium]|nr:metallophosphoesterase [Phycisphaerales bacterium]
MTTTWVTADTHFGQAEAIELFGRPFAPGDTKAMDELLLERINMRVGKRDRLIHLGDFTGPREWKGQEGRKSLKELRLLRKRIVCRQVELVVGNQDPSPKRARRVFEDARTMLTWRGWSGGSERIVCFHYPMRTWQGALSGAMHLHGHMHGRFPPLGRSRDVGVDCWEYGPVKLDEVLSALVATPIARGAGD